MVSRRYGDEMIAFLVAGAKASALTGPLEGYLPQLLLELAVVGIFSELVFTV